MKRYPALLLCLLMLLALAGFPTGNGLIGDVQRLCQLLLRQLLFPPQLRDQRAGLHGHSFHTVSPRMGLIVFSITKKAGSVTLCFVERRFYSAPTA